MNPTLEMTIEAGDREWFLLELADAWRAAHGEATLAYEHWREQPGPNGYAVYRAAQDRADQAQEVLARAARAAGCRPSDPRSSPGINRGSRRH